MVYPIRQKRIDAIKQETIDELDTRLRYAVQQTHMQPICASKQLKTVNVQLVEQIDDDLYTFIFVCIHEHEYGIVTEDVRDGENIQIDFSDGRTWRVPRRMVEYSNNPPAHIQQEFKNLLPQCRDEDLITRPPLNELRMMFPSQLASVHNFEIIHKPTGSRIFFRGKTDLRSVDIGEAIRFSESVIEIYPNSSVPPFNTKLNREAFVELRYCFPSDTVTIEKYCRRLKRLCDTRNAQFVSYKPEENGTWSFIVQPV